jgi:hypothetical protein
VKKQVMVEGVVEVSEYALHAHEMRLTGIMHVEAHLLDCVGDVRPGEGEVLESLGQARVANRVADPPPHVRGDLGLSIDWRGVGLAITHVSALKDIPNVLVLVKEETVRSPLHWDAEEVVKRVDVLYHELLPESHSDTVEKLWVRGGEDDDIDVE